MDSAELVMCLLCCEFQAERQECCKGYCGSRSVLVCKGGVHGGSGFIYLVCKAQEATFPLHVTIIKIKG